MNLFGLLFRTVLQLQIANRSLADLVDAAKRSKETLLTQWADKADNDKNRQQLRHIIGIERWGQRRLKTLLGEIPLQDEYDHYQPPPSDNFARLRTLFADTRQETLALVDTIRQRGTLSQATAYHNMMGNISLKVWLRYLTLHANFEGRSIH